MTRKMFDDELLHTFMQSFYGYGNYQGDFWFIGMEERVSPNKNLSESEEEDDLFNKVQNRLSIWQGRGHRQLEDLVDYHTALGITDQFRDAKPKLQSTWSRLIRILLRATRNVQPTKDDVRAYQQKYWARSNGNECLLELLPLPSPSTKHWLYDKYSHLPSLTTREQYRHDWVKIRTAGLKDRIERHHPKAVIFYSFDYLDYWQAIIGSKITQSQADEFYMCQTAQTLFVVSKHPSTRGMTNDYFHNVGQFIKNELSQS